MRAKFIVTHVIFIISTLLFLQPALAETINFGGVDWEYEESDRGQIKIEPFLGRDAIYIRRNTITRKGDALKDVVIEYDYAPTHQSGFIGVNFRINPEGTGNEQFYTRPHQSGQPDAAQYMGAINNSATWQLHAGPNDATAVNLPARQWTKIRIVAIGDQADIFVGDMDTPLLHVADLRFDGGAGDVSLYASDRRWVKDTGAYFSNIVVRAATTKDKLIGTPRKVEPLPKGLLKSFEVSKSFSEDEMDNRFSLKDLDAEKGDWQTLEVESDGIANLARVQPLTREKNTVLVRFNIQSDTKVNRLLSFGYSDRIRLFVDGKLIYSGNAQWRSRDHRFLGTIALVDQVALDISKGQTEIIAAVSESFGGWGFKAQIEDQSGFTITPN